jgi:GT2 family glycosyltransferase
MKTMARRLSHPVFFSAEWQPAGVIERLFVKYRSTDPSPAQIRYRNTANGPVRLSVVIPTLDGSRGGCLSHLLKQIEEQNFRDFETFVVKGDPRQGRAINFAAALAEGDYLLTLDDDTSLPDPDTFGKLIDAMEEQPAIGIAGGNNLVPEDAPPLVRRAMREIPRRSWAMVAAITDSDLAEHPCMIMRTAEFKQVGGENELLPRGLDPYLRMEYRKLGKRVVVVPGIVYYHLPPAPLGRLLRQFHRNGRDAAYVNRHHPGWVLETPAHHGPFRERVPFARRALRFPWQLFSAIRQAKPLWFLSELAYGVGFICGYLRLK